MEARRRHLPAHPEGQLAPPRGARRSLVQVPTRRSPPCHPRGFGPIQRALHDERPRARTTGIRPPAPSRSLRDEPSPPLPQRLPDPPRSAASTEARTAASGASAAMDETSISPLRTRSASRSSVADTRAPLSPQAYVPRASLPEESEIGR